MLATWGGGLVLDQEAGFNGGLNVVISNDTFVNNQATEGAATFAIGEKADGLSNCLVTFVNDNFTANIAAGDGGGAAFTSMNVQINNSNFVGNIAGASAGAIDNSNTYEFLGEPSTTLSVTNSNFIGNIAQGSVAGNNIENQFVLVQVGLPLVQINGGGAIWNNLGGNLIVGNSTFIGNNSQNGDGGALLNSDPTIQFLPPLPTSASITQSRFIGNIASTNGGAIASEDLASSSPSQISITLNNNTLMANSAQNGGALYLSASVATVTGNTFAFDEASNAADEIYATNSQVNGIASSNSTALLNNLKATNTFAFLDNDDFFLI